MQAAIVFDLDGVLVDTEPLKARAHRSAVEERGGELSLDLYRRAMGNPHEEVIRAFLSAAGLEASPGAAAAYEETFRAAYRRLLRSELEPAPGAEALLAACREQGRPLALVTSSDPWMVDFVVDRLGWSGTFRATVTAADVPAEKPDPAPYRRARAALGAAGDAAVAVEDTPAGAASAAGAGLPVIAVRHRFNRDRDFGAVAAVVESLAPAAAFLGLADRVAAPRPRGLGRGRTPAVGWSRRPAPGYPEGGGNPRREVGMTDDGAGGGSPVDALGAAIDGGLFEDGEHVGFSVLRAWRDGWCVLGGPTCKYFVGASRDADGRWWVTFGPVSRRTEITGEGDGFREAFTYHLRETDRMRASEIPVEAGGGAGAVRDFLVALHARVVDDLDEDELLYDGWIVWGWGSRKPWPTVPGLGGAG